MSLPSEEGDRSADEIDPEESDGAEEDGPSAMAVPPEAPKTPPMPAIEPQETKPLVGFLTVHQPDGQMLNVPVQVDPSVLIKCSSGSTAAVVSGGTTMASSQPSPAVKVGEFSFFLSL